MSSEKQALFFVVESGTDIRLVRGLAARFRLTLLIRPVPSGRAISWPYDGRESIEVREGPANRVAFALWAALQARRARADGAVVLAQNYGPLAVVLATACRAARVPCALLICSPSFEYFRARWRKRELDPARWALGASAFLASRRLSAALASHHVVLSPYLAGAIGPVPAGRVSIVPVYGVDTRRFVPVNLDEKLRLRRELDLPDAPLVIFSSRIAAEKDTETLLRAASILREAGRDVWFLNLSGGHREFIDRASRAGMADRVLARDAVHPERDLASYYQTADVCVQASTEEGLGFSPLEALACETPVVAAAVGGLRDTIVPGETGATYPVGDAETLAARIGAILDDPAAARVLARNGRRMVAERYDVEVAFAALERVVGALGAGAKGRA